MAVGRLCFLFLLLAASLTCSKAGGISLSFSCSFTPLSSTLLRLDCIATGFTPDSYTCSTDGGPTAACVIPMDVDTSVFSSGTHTIAVTPISARFGNLSALTSSPSFEVGGGGGGSLSCTQRTTSTDVTINCTGVEISRTECSFDSGAFADCDLPIVAQFNDYSVGRHSLRARFTIPGGQAEQDFNFDVPAEVDCEREIKLNCDAQDRCDYRASYAVSGNDVCFNISARTTGWVGIGFSLDQLMPNSDIVLGATSSERTCVDDRFATAQAEPAIDASQDITDVTATHDNGITTITFTRPRVSTDNRDLSLDQCVYFLYAWGGSIDYSTCRASYHGFNRRVPSGFQFCIPDNCAVKPTPEPLNARCTLQQRGLMFTIDCTANKELQMTECSLNNMDFESCTLPRTIDANEFVPGQYNYTVKLTDLDGQELTVVVPFTVPVRLDVSCETTNNDTHLNVMCSANKSPTTVECSYDGGSFEECPESQEISLIGSPGNHTLDYRYTDQDGFVATVRISYSIRGAAQLQCFSMLNCGGTAISEGGTIEDCCLGDGLTFTEPGSGTCRTCIVYGWIDGPNFVGNESITPYILSVGFIKGGENTGMTLAYSVDVTEGSAEEGANADFTVTNRNLIHRVAIGLNPSVSTILRVDDLAQETDETFQLTLVPNPEDPSSAFPGSNEFLLDTITVTIIDQERVTFSFPESDYIGPEPDEMITVRVRRNAPIANPVTLLIIPLNYTEYIDSGFVQPIDFPEVPPENVFTPNRAKSFPLDRRDFNITPIEITFEPDEINAALDISVPIAIFDDEINEVEAEIFVAILELVDAINPSQVDFRDATLCRITDNDPIFIGFERSEYRVDETDTVFTGEDSPISIIKENGVVSEQTFRASITAGPADLPGIANAEFPLDYSVGVGQTSVFELLPEEQSIGYPFEIFADELPEGEEAFGLTLATTSGEGGSFSVGTIGSTVVIIEDDDDVIVGFEETTVTVTENEGRAELCVRVFVPADADPLAVTFFLDPTTIAGTADTSDYEPLSAFGNNPLGTAQFGDSLRQFCFDVTIIDDTQFEITETFRVTIQLSFDSPMSGIVVNPAEAVITILDDDELPLPTMSPTPTPEVPSAVMVEFEQSTYTVSEGDGSTQVCVEVSGVPPGGLESEIVVTLDTADGTAVEDIDYSVADPLTVTFPTTSVSGDTACADITILDDDDVRGDISFSVHLISSTPSGVTFSGHLYITVTIQDDDLALLFIDCIQTLNGASNTLHYSCQILSTNPIVNTTCSYDGGPPEPCNLTQFENFDISTYPVGPHSVVIAVEDSTGLTDTFTINFEGPPPGPPPLTTSCIALGVTGRFHYGCTTSNTLVRTVCSYDSGPEENCTLPITIVPRAEFFSVGDHILTINFTDIYGQTAVEEFAFSVPEALEFECSVVSETSLGITINCTSNNDLADQQCSFDGGNSFFREGCDIPLFIDYSSPSFLIPGDYDIVIFVLDVYEQSATANVTITIPEPLIECEGNFVDGQAIFDCPALEDVENVTNIQCSVDGGVPEDCMFPLEIPLVSPSVSVVVTGTDQDNNIVVIGRAEVTLPDLDLYFTNDTPVVFGIGAIIAEFGYTPRPELTVQCHLTRLDSSRDNCSSGRYERTDIPPGDYTLRVVARDRSTGERAIIRSGFRISGDNTFCTVVLINRGVTVDGNNVTVEFAGSGIVSQFACIMDRQEYMPCISPLTVTGLDPGPHDVKINPTDCGRNYRATRAKFTIN